MTANTCRCGLVLDPIKLPVLGREITLTKTLCGACVEEERARERELERQRAVAERQALVDAKLLWVPRRFRDAKCDHEASHSWVSVYLTGERRSLVFTGPVGIGKTYELWGIYRALTEARPNLHIEAWSVPTLLDQLRPGNDDEVLDMMLVANVIMLDDLGAENPSPWTIERLFRIVDHCWEHQIPIVATTNTPRQRLAEFIGQRTTSRLLDPEMTDVVVLKGEDRRRVARHGA